MFARRRPAFGAALLCAAALNGCGGHGLAPAALTSPTTGFDRSAVPSISRAALAMDKLYPKSVSPGAVRPASMPAGPKMPAGWMESHSRGAAMPQALSGGLNWSGLPGLVSQVAVDPKDGSLLALSTSPSGQDKTIFQYKNGSWTQLPGLASRLAFSPDGNTLYALNSTGAIFSYSFASNTWTGLAGGASDVSVALDGTLFVLSNGGDGGTGNYPVWHYVNGTWSQFPGAANRIAASWDPYQYTINGVTLYPGGFYVFNTAGAIYYYSPSVGYAQFPGAAASLAPVGGGLFVIGSPEVNQGGAPIYFYDLTNPGWSLEPGAASSVAASNTQLYAVNALGNLYNSPITLTGAPTPAPGGLGPNGGWGPSNVTSAFDYPITAGYNGTGATVAIIGSSGPPSSDLTAYLAYFGVQQTGSYTAREVGGSKGNDNPLEATLDVETVAGLAPGANVIYYEIPSLTNQYILDAINQIIIDKKAQVVSMSFGGCEGFDSATSAAFASGAQSGVAFIASSGDQGDHCYVDANTYSVGVNYPASDPNVIGAGGTESFQPPTYTLTTPQVWNDYFFNGNQGAGGGGVSGEFLLPYYQSSTNILATASSNTYRNVPDIAMPAVGTATFFQGQWVLVGGTSWSAPEFASMLAEVFQFCRSAFRTPVTLPYYAFANGAYNNYIDVTAGNNGWAFSGKPDAGYPATAGYDNASGIGMPLGMPFANTVCPGGVPASKARAAASSFAARQAAAVPSSAIPIPRIVNLQDAGPRADAQMTRFAVAIRPEAAAQAHDGAVAQYLSANGVTILTTYGTHMLIDAEAPALVVNRLFGTSLHDFRDQSGTMRYANATVAAVPAAIASNVQAVILNDLIVAWYPPLHVR